jgi:flagellar biosynthesis protein FlhG
MVTRPRRRDWQILGLQPGADPTDVRRSYLRRKALYSPDSMASYTLLEDEERAELLERIEEAYRRITGTPAPPSETKPTTEQLPEAPEGPAPPVTEQPGAHLRHQRIRQSRLLAQVAAEIKVRASLLERLEGEEFSYLPAAVYVRGFVLQYARFLGLSDPDGVAAAYLAKMAAASLPEE